MPVCASLGHLADATWSHKTWEDLAGWLQTLLSAAMYAKLVELWLQSPTLTRHCHSARWAAALLS